MNIWSCVIGDLNGLIERNLPLFLTSQWYSRADGLPDHFLISNLSIISEKRCKNPFFHCLDYETEKRRH